METFWILCLGLLYLDPITCLPEEFKTEVRGYGNTHGTVMRPRCEYPTIMAVRDMYGTSKKKDLGCPVSILNDTGIDPICIVIEEGDCTLEFDTTKRDPYLECTGKIECDVGTDWQQMIGTCGSSYMESSHIMSMEYNCIPSASILDFNTVDSQTDVTETYISNEGFPNALTSSSGGTCFITSCSTGIIFGLIDLRFSKSGGVCQQSLTITDGGTTTVYDCDDNNHLQYKQKYTSVTSSIYVTLTVTSPTPDSFVWIDVSGDRMAVHCGVSESFTLPEELDCSTTTQATTTSNTPTTSTKVSSTSTTTNSTTTTTSTTTTRRTTGEPTNEDSQSYQPSVIAIVGLAMGIIGTAVSIVLAIMMFVKKPMGKVQDVPNSGENGVRNNRASRGFNDQKKVLGPIYGRRPVPPIDTSA